MTIKDIAKISGYAVSTVSRAINNHPDVSEEARKKIIECVEEYNFKLNTNAKLLKQSRPSAISVIIKGTKNAMFASIVEKIQEHLKDREVNVYYIDEELDEVLYGEMIANERCPLGIIFLGGLSHNFLESFHKITVPSVLVTLDASTFGFENLSSVCLDDREAAKHAIGLLIANGHQQIGVVGGDVRVSGPAAQRIEGVKEMLTEHGLKFGDHCHEVCKFSSAGSYKATIRLLEKNPELTAIFCMADIMAIGAMRAIYDLGKCVPDDISLVGFDGLDLVQFCVPRIDTVKQDIEQLAIKSVEILESAIEKKIETQHYRIPYSIQRGESIRRL